MLCCGCAEGSTKQHDVFEQIFERTPITTAIVNSENSWNSTVPGKDYKDYKDYTANGVTGPYFSVDSKLMLSQSNGVVR